MGTGSLQNEIKNFEEKNDNIFIHEPVTHHQVTKIASSADFGICLIENVSLSNYYCLPNKLFENIFAGLPVIVSNFPDMGELVKKYGVGIIVENSAETLMSAVEKIDSVAFNKENFSFSNLFELSWDCQAEKIKSVYESILA
jgi:glycosyltransferase involved in cell wall biosynthesis